MRIRGDNFEELIADMEAAIREFTERVSSDPALWPRGRPGKWTVGRHADHVAAGLRVTAVAFERSEQALRSGALSGPPGRWPPEALFIALVVGAGRFPRGGRAPKSIMPQFMPEVTDVMTRLGRETARFRPLGERLTPEERDRLWIASPFMRSWHYRFPEILRLHAVHTRHHARLVAEIAATR